MSLNNSTKFTASTLNGVMNLTLNPVIARGLANQLDPTLQTQHIL